MTRTLVPAALALLVAACGGGPAHVAEITPAVSQRLSGVWTLDAEASDDPEEAMRRGEGPGDAGGRGQPGMGGRRGGMAGGRGGMRPGGSMGGRPPLGGTGGGPPDPAAARALRRLATGAPRRLEIALSDSSVVLTSPREEPWVISFSGDVTRVVDDEVEVEARAEWENGRLVVTRRVSGGGWVAETFMPSVDGTRLVVAVAFAPGGRGGVEFTRVYRRGEETGRRP